MAGLPTPQGARALVGLVEETLDLLEGYTERSRSETGPAAPLKSLLDQCRAETRAIEGRSRPALSLIAQMPGAGGAVLGLIAAAQPGVILIEGADPFAPPGGDLPAKTDLIALARRPPRPVGPGTAGAMFLAGLNALADQTKRSGQHLVLRQTAALSAGMGHADIVPLLGTEFDLSPVLCVRHPLDGYLSHRAAAGIGAMAPEDYMARSLALLADHVDWPRFAYEDVVSDPMGMAPSLMAALGLPHQRDWPDLFPAAAHGMPVPKGRGAGPLRTGPTTLPRRPLPGALAEAIAAMPDYQRLCELLGYDPEPGGDVAPERDIASDANRLAARLDEAKSEGDLDSAAYQVLRSELDTLSHELSLAQQRGQMDGRGTDAPAKLQSFAQLGQDLWVLERTGYRHGGFFVEFGATDGVLLSNSYLLEKEYGWDGLCAEPNPEFFAKLKKNRTCTLSPDCIGPRSGDTVRFVLADVYGGIRELGDDDHHAATRDAYAARGAEVVLTTISLDDFLRKYEAPKRIDYLSIDTEGSEYAILSTFPFAEWDIRLITVEHNFTPQRDQIYELLTEHGYRRIEKEWDDWYWKPGP